MSRAPHPCRRPAVGLSLALAAALAGCEIDDDDRFRLVPFAASHPSTPGRPPVSDGIWVVYFADEAREAGGTDLNGDGDAADSVAVAIDVTRRTEDVLGVAAVEAAVVGNQVFLVVDEAAELPDGTALDPGSPPFTLAHWSRQAGAVTRFDELGGEPGPHLFASDDRLYFASGNTPTAADESSLRFVTETAPTVPTPVPATDGPLGAVPFALTDGLLAVRLPETAAATPAGDWPDGDRNGDGDEDDDVLAFLDTTAVDAPLRSTGLAVTDLAFDARSVAGDEWLAAFLVDEGAQGVDLNDPSLFDPAWLPEACPGLAADGAMAGRSVLHWAVVPRGAPAGGAALEIGNTGLVGSDRVVALTDVVATLSPEAATGCDLNGDGDTADTVARWAEARTAPVLPPVLTSELNAVALGAGPSRGLSSVGERLVVVVDEAADGRDHDGKADDHLLVASRDPLEPLESALVFRHRSGVAVFDEGLEAFVTTDPFVGTTWMAARPSLGRLPLTCVEAVPDVVLNRNDFCNEVLKDSDTTDAVVAWPRVRSDLERELLEPDLALTFPGVGYAVFPDDPGFVVAGAVAFFRVSEGRDGRDHNGDGDRSDAVLYASQLTSCALSFLGTATAPGTGPVVATDGLFGAAFLTDETMDGVDLDGDGDAEDLVVRYLRL